MVRRGTNDQTFCEGMSKDVWNKRAMRGEGMTRKEFYKWYLSTDWILSDTKPMQSGSGLMEVSIGRFSDRE